MPKKLLVADKSVVIQKSVGITFAQEDFTVTYVSDGEDALAKARQIKPDLALVHINTPKMSGYDVCHAIRKDPQLTAIPVLLLVGTHESLDETRVKACGADGHIIKPFESQALIDRVNELITTRKAGPAVAAPVPPGPKPTAPPPPADPSPAATISGAAPMTPAAPPQPATPSPAATIAGQPAVSRDVPMLDLDVAEPEILSPAEAANAFDFAFDSSLTPDAKPAAVEISSEIDLGSPEPPAETTTAEAPASWEFAEPPAVEPRIEIEPAAAPEPPSVDTGDFGFAIGAGAEEEPATFAEPPTGGFDLTSQPIETELAPESNVRPEITQPRPRAPQAPVPPAVSDFAAPAVAATVAAPAVAAPAVALTDAQIEQIVTKVFRQVIERIAWEVVPDLAETLIKEELTRLTQEKP
jgi:CheY-like chemotaxis protein